MIIIKFNKLQLNRENSINRSSSQQIFFIFCMSKSDIAIQSNVWENNSVLREKRQNSNKQNYMPFLFRSKRQFINKKHQIPPVGSYKLPSSFQQGNTSSHPDLLKFNLNSQKQMGIFKSSQQRFIIQKNNVPGPATYNFTNTQSRTKFLKIQKKSPSKKLQVKMDLIKRSPSCPAIPDSRVRYGYAKDSQGHFKLIQKTEDQIQKQKLKLKEYLSTLDGQSQFSKRSKMLQQPYLSIKNKQQKQILNHLQKHVERRSMSQSRISSGGKSKDFVKLTKPKIKLSYGVNLIKHNQDHLGPGCYDVSLDTLKKAKKDENFQFFCSSEVRFKPMERQTALNPYEQIFKEKKNLVVRQKWQGKVYKKSFPTSPIDPSLLQKEQLPGPGYYDPQFGKTKKSQGNTKFGFESRFKQNTIEPQQVVKAQIGQILQQKQFSNIKWGNLRKDKIKSPQKSFTPVSSSQIHGINNEESSEIKNSINLLKLNINKNKQSAVFLDRSQRFSSLNKTLYQPESQSFVKENSPKRWESKGCFMSKLPKKQLQIKENTPGPGAYQHLTLAKKNFNIKHQ